MSLEFVARHGIISLGSVQVTGSITATGGINISGSIASASYAESSSYAVSSSNSISSSFSSTASYLLNNTPTFPYTGSAVISGSLLITGSLNVSNQIESQVFITPQTLSRDISIPDYHNALILGPSNIEGNITVGTGSNLIVIEDFTNLATTGSNTFTGNQIISGSLNVTQGITGSLLGNASTATSASYAATSSFATNFTASNILVTGTVTAQTLNVQQVTSSVIYSSGSNIFGNSLSDTQQLTGSVTVTGSLSLNGYPVIMVNQTSSLVVASASFATSASLAQTASYFITSSVTSASFATSASNAVSASNSISGSYALTASYALNGGSGGSGIITVANGGVTQGTASYFDFTGAGVTATVSADTASISISGGGGGSTSAGQTTTFTQSVAADPWTFTHNLNTRTPLVQVYDSSYNQITPQYVSASSANTVIITFGVATAGYAVASMGGTLVVTGSNVILNQSVAAATWSFNHNLNTQYPVFQVFNSDNEVVIPERVVASTPTSSFIYFPTAVSGYAVASVGGLSGSYSASYALTASFALNGGGSGTTAVANQGTFIGTASYFDYVGNNISASVVNNTASITIIGATGTSALTQSVAAPTWSFTHNLNTFTPLIQVYDSSYNQLIPNAIVGISSNVAEIRFDYSQSGYAIASNGGTLTVSGSTAQLNQTVAATTWSFAHNLNSKYVNFEVYDSNDFVVIPADIKAVDANNADLYFAAPTAGTAIAMFSGISGAPNAVTASFATTASYLNPVTNGYVVLTQVSQSLNFVDDVAAAAAGVPLGGLYRNGNFIAIRIT